MNRQIAELFQGLTPITLKVERALISGRIILWRQKGNWGRNTRARCLRTALSATAIAIYAAGNVLASVENDGCWACNSFCPRHMKWGLSEKISAPRVWVLPNPSGLNAHYQIRDLVLLFEKLRRAAEHERSGRAACRRFAALWEAGELMPRQACIL